MEKIEILRGLLRDNRSTRRFDAARPVDRDTLTGLIGLTRLCASGRNCQPLKYRIVADADECSAVYPALKWAGYYTDWDGPEPAERPTAYLVQCLDTDIAADCLCDDGLQLEAISLGAVAEGLRCCIIKAFDANAVRKTLGIPERFKLLYVLALGYGVENIRLVDMETGQPDGFKYYRLPDGTHCVPKRPLEALIID